jgi:hypothetical protein
LTTTPTQQQTIADVAYILNSIFKKRIDQAKVEMNSHDAEIRRIKSLSKMSEDKEREKALGPAEIELKTMEKRFEKWRRDVGWFGLKTPFKTLERWRKRQSMRKEYLEKVATFDSASEQNLRTKNISVHNAAVNAELAKLDDLQTIRGNIADRRAVYSELWGMTAEAIRAAGSSGWLEKNFKNDFFDMAVFIQNEKIEEAAKILPTLVFQREPSKENYAKWANEAKDAFEKAYTTYAGYAASSAYTGMAASSVDLAVPHIRDDVSFPLSDFPHVADRWQLLGKHLQDPRNLKTDAMWALYWSMFQSSQWMAKSFDETESNENVQTGELFAQLDRWLSDWCAPRMEKFGYPKSRSYLGTFKIASTAAETYLAADIGIIVDINVGDLKCKKVALFQAKKATQGKADIGSSSSQLQKLSSRPNIGYYLFYHLAHEILSPPAPTVCSALSLAEIAKQGNRDIEAKYLPVDVRELGWDFAHFISFGLCDAKSEYGQAFETVDEAFSILGNGDPTYLPKHLALIAIADEPNVLELRKEIAIRYMPRAKQKQLSTEKTISRDGPTHELSIKF